MSAGNIFGTIVSPRQIELAMAATIQLWIDDYLHEIERLEGYLPAQIERPRGVISRSEFEKWPEEQVPLILIMTTGLAGPAERRADGVYDAAWLVDVVSIVSDVDRDETRTLTLSYAAAVRALILQHKMLKSALYPNGFADFSRWQNETYVDLPALAERSLGAARSTFSIGVSGVVTEQAGPRAPLSDPSLDPGPLPTVQSATAKPIPIGIGDPLP